MKFKLLQFNKSLETIDQFSDLLQKTLNEANDLVRMEAFENTNGNTVYVALTFGKEKTGNLEVLGFYAVRLSELEEQVSATIAIAYEQGKHVVSMNVVPYSKSHRAIGFLVLQKSKETVDADQEQKRETAARKQNSKANARTNAGPKG